MFCLINENNFYFYSKTIKIAETKVFFHGFSINGTLKYNDVLKNNIIKTFILPSTNRIQAKLSFVTFVNEINKYMVPYNMITLANETIKKARHDEEQETMRRSFAFYFSRKNSTLRDDISLFNQYTYYEYFLEYNTARYPAFYGCYSNIFVTDNFHEEFDYDTDLDFVRDIYKVHFTEGIDYVMRKHIERIENENNSTFFTQSKYIKDILVNVHSIISLIIDDLYAEIGIKYNFNRDEYFSQYKTYSKSYDDEDDDDYGDDDYYDDDDDDDDDGYGNDEYDDDDYDNHGNDDYDDDYDEYDDDEYSESDDSIYTSYRTDSYLNFILDKNRGDFILDLSFTYFLQYFGLDRETYSYSLFELGIKLMRDRKDIKFSMHININADEIYNKSDLRVVYKQDNKDIVQVSCDYEQNIKENQFRDYHFINASKDSKYLSHLNKIDKLVSKIVSKKININFSMIV